MTIYAVFLEGFRSFFTDSSVDPLVISLLAGTAKPDLLQIITTDSESIITHRSQRLIASFTHSRVNAGEEDAGILTHA